MFKGAFKRTTSSGNYIAEIDGFRFLAIFLVIAFHNNIWSNELHGLNKSSFYKIIDMGNIGVQFFFVISGFIIAMPFIKSFTQNREINLGSYFLRRFTRLEPPYLIAMFGFYTAAFFLSTHNLDNLIKHYLATIIYSHGFIFDTRSLINSVSWSLEIEIQFYIIAPILFFIFKIKTKIIVITLLSIISVLWPLLFDIIGYNYLNILGYFHYFTFGALLCYIYLNYKFTSSYLFDLLSVILFFLIFVLFRHKQFFINYFLGITIFLIYLFLLNSKLIIKFFRLEIISTIGGMCYSIYLIHSPLTSYLKKVQYHFISFNSYEIDFIIGLLIILPIVIVSSSIFFILIEKPFMSFKAKDLRKNLLAYRNNQIK
ncbi:acyltransferase [Flavobacteriaceae bacterium]|nr:acyltransferase [Flavobacteriaceae bacterium]